MKIKILTTMAVTGLMVAGLTTAAWAASPKMITQKPEMKMTIPLPESIMTPATVESSIGTLDFFDGIPTDGTVSAVYDYVDRAPFPFTTYAKGIDQWGLLRVIKYFFGSSLLIPKRWF